MKHFLQNVANGPGRPGAALRARFPLGCLLLLLLARPAAADVPDWLPRYDLDIRLEVGEHRAVVRERLTWTNRHQRPTSRVVFNAHSHYVVPDKDVPFFAKMLELLRLGPDEVLDSDGPPLQLEKTSLLVAKGQPVELPFAYQAENYTALEVKLPGDVGPGQSVTLELAFTLRLPQKQGRWGQWRGVTFLAQWLPVLAYYDDAGWQPVPFVPWHQPFFNEAGLYTAHITLPVGQTLACTGAMGPPVDLGDGWKRIEVAPIPARDFAVFCSARFKEFVGQAGPVTVRCFARPDHAFYAHEMLRIVAEALPVYESWFGPFPYAQFTVVESYFGWNGNECGDLVMIDERIFGMAHAARNYVDGLLSHELCHQWWYNAVGTNGYAETWMDEALATHFCHRLLDRKLGKNNTLLIWPAGLTWLPNIHREDFRYYMMLGVEGRGEACVTVQDMPGFTHLVNLSAMAYDRGGKIFGMIEDRLGEAAFFDFMRRVYARYCFRIIRIADFRRELEDYTGHSWKEFFDHWLYGKGMTDWCVENVTLTDATGTARRWPRVLPDHSFLTALRHASAAQDGPCRATILLRQKGECLEQTVLGISLDGSDHYQIRLPILPEVPELEVADPPARVLSLGGGRVRVEVALPCRPTQVTVDPDQVLLDRNPANNSWKPRLRYRLTPLYFELDETDVTNAYDRWNFIMGPWVYSATYDDPWYTRSPMAGFRAGLYRTQDFSGGAYLAYRSDDRNIVAGVDGLLDHWPWPHTQVGFDVEHSLATLGGEDTRASRAVLFGRYIFNYSSSLYLPPIDYLEAFTAVQNRSLPTPRQTFPGADLFEDQTVLGLHYHLDYQTPYWDPQGGFTLDATYQEGFPVFGEDQHLHEFIAQASAVKGMPDWLKCLRKVPGLGWVPDTRLAGRVYGAAALPENAQVLSLGGGELFRGFDLSERQGNLVWIASLEWRVPLATGLEWDCCDHVVGLRNVWGAAFYDVGDCYLESHSFGPVAHAVGLSLRLDIAWFSLIERTMIRFDIAKTVGSAAPVQFWFGLRHPF
jgi:hypothetical protein